MNWHRLRFWIYSVLSLLVFFGLARLYYRLTDDFRLSNITYQIDSQESWYFPLSPEQKTQLAQILPQKFYYMGKGAQCYAFVSEDQKYVLKFFKFKHLKPNILVQLLPPIPPFKQYKEAIIEKKKRKLYNVFEGYELAYRENKKESELIYLHLVPTYQEVKQVLTVVDKLGLERKINLDDVVFLVQSKGETLRTRMNQQLRENHVEEAKVSIAHILAMYMNEYQKGVYDRDHGVMHNTGFVQDRPFHLDVGKFSKDDRMRLVEFYKKDLEHIVWKIDTWVKNNYPTHYTALASFLAEQYQAYTGEYFDAALIDPQRFKKKKH